MGPHDDGTLKLWDAQTGEERATLAGHQSAVISCAFSPDGRTVASGDADSVLKVWDVYTALHAPQRDPQRAHRADVEACAFSPDGKSIASVDGDGVLAIWDAATGHLRLSIHTQPPGLVSDCAFSLDGTTIVTAGVLSRIRLWNARTGDELQPLAINDVVRRPSLCAFSPDGTMLLTVSEDRRLIVWSVTTDHELATLVSGTKPVYACGFSRDGATIFAMDGFGMLTLWDVRTQKAVTTLRAGTEGFNTCAFGPDGTSLLTTCTDTGTVQLWDIADQRHIRTFPYADYAWQSAFCPDGILAVSAGGYTEGELHVWDVPSCQERALLRLPASLHSVATHPVLPYVVAGGGGGWLYIAEFVGMTYGPLLVTAADHDNRTASARCPACGHLLVLRQEQLGTTMTCPTAHCGAHVRINPVAISSMRLDAAPRTQDSQAPASRRPYGFWPFTGGAAPETMHASLDSS